MSSSIRVFPPGAVPEGELPGGTKLRGAAKLGCWGTKLLSEAGAKLPGLDCDALIVPSVSVAKSEGCTKLFFAGWLLRFSAVHRH